MKVSGVKESIRDLNLEIEGYLAVKISARDYANEQEYRLTYENGLIPRGKIKFIIPYVRLDFKGPWSISWQPVTPGDAPSGQ